MIGSICGFVVIKQGGDRRINGDVLAALGDQNLTDDPFVDGFKFHGCLIRFDLGQQVARGHGVARFDQPLSQRPLFHGW